MARQHTIVDLPVGTELHYSGDMANVSGKGIIVKHRPATEWSHISVDIQLEDGRDIKGIAPCMFDKTPGQRFHIMTEWQAERAEKIAQMKADFERVMALKAVR